MTEELVAAVRAVVPSASVRSQSGRIVVELDGPAPRTAAWGRRDGKEPDLVCPLDRCDYPARGEGGLSVHLARFHHLAGAGPNKKIRADLIRQALDTAGVVRAVTAALSSAGLPVSAFGFEVAVIEPRTAVLGVATVRLRGTPLVPHRPTRSRVDRPPKPKRVVTESPVVTEADDDGLDPNSDEWAHARGERARKRQARVAGKTPAPPVEKLDPDRPKVPWVSAPIERRPFDPDAARRGAYSASGGLVDL